MCISRQQAVARYSFNPIGSYFTGHRLIFHRSDVKPIESLYKITYEASRVGEKVA